MKNIVFTLNLLIITVINGYALDMNPVELRKKFYYSVESGKVAREFLAELETNTSKDPLIKGYRAAVSMVMANHAFNPYSKFKYFIDGRRLLENTLKDNPTNIELRLIRFAIQTNVPSFLGYSSEIKADKEFLIKNLNSLNVEKEADKQLKSHIVNYLILSKVCNKQELDLISKT